MKMRMSQNPNLKSLDLKNNLFTGVYTYPATLMTDEQFKNLIWDRYQKRRPIYLEEDELIVDSDDLARFLSEWRRMLQVSSKQFTNAIVELNKDPVFKEYLDTFSQTNTHSATRTEELNAVIATDGTTLNTGTQTTAQTGTNTNVNNATTSQTDSSDTYNVHEEIPLQTTADFVINSGIKNAQNRDVNKDNSTTSGTNNATNTETLNTTNTQTNNLTNTNSVDTVQNNDNTITDSSTDTSESTKSGYTKPVWEIVDSYMKIQSPFYVLWRELDELFASHYTIEVI